MWDKIRHNPVAALATLITILTAADGSLTAVGVLSPALGGWLGGLIAVLTAVLGAITHGKVTPLAAPKDSSGRPLVPLK